MRVFCGVIDMLGLDFITARHQSVYRGAKEITLRVRRRERQYQML